MASRKNAEVAKDIKSKKPGKPVPAEEAEDVEVEETVSASGSDESTDASEEASRSRSGSTDGDGESDSGSDSESDEGSDEEEESDSKTEEEIETTDPSKRTVFIKGISYDATEAELEKKFSKYGEVVEVRIPRCRERNKGKGFAYIEFSNEASAKKSMEITGETCDGRRLVVDIASAPRKAEGGEKSFSSGGDGESNSTLFLANLPYEFEKEDLHSYLSDIAEIEDLRVPMDQEGRSKGFAFVKCKSKKEARKLMDEQLSFCKRVIRVQVSSSSRPGGRDGGFRGGRDRDGFRGRGDEFGERKRSSFEENASNKKHVKFSDDE